MPGRAITIFLVDGSVSGLRTADLGFEATITAVVVPRASLSRVTKRPELLKTGVYVRVGSDSERPGYKKVYVGETDTILSRLTRHNKDQEKDFWEEAVVFVSKDESFLKQHARVLEARLIALARTAKRATVTNGTTPPEQRKFTESFETAMKQIVDQVLLLLGTLGYGFFEPVASGPGAGGLSAPTTAARLPEFVYSGEGFSATCRVNLEAGQFIVEAGSTARKREAAAVPSAYRNLRSQLQRDGVLGDHDASSFSLSQDYAFSSITAGAVPAATRTASATFVAAPTL